MKAYSCTVFGNDETGYDLMITGTEFRVMTFLTFVEANAAKIMAGVVIALNPLHAALEIDARLARCGFYTVNRGP